MYTNDTKLAKTRSRLPTVTSARLFWPLVFALLAYLCVVQVRSAMQESVTADEPVEISSGYSYLKTGDFRMEPLHPPLSKMFAALPLLLFPITPPREIQRPGYRAMHLVSARSGWRPTPVKKMRWCSPRASRQSFSRPASAWP